MQLTLGIHSSKIGLMIDRLLSWDSTKKILHRTLLRTWELQIHNFCVCWGLICHPTRVFNYDRVWMFHGINRCRTRWLCVLIWFLYFLFLRCLSFYLELALVGLLINLSYFSRCSWRCVIWWLYWMLVLVSVSRYMCGLGVTILYVLLRWLHFIVT